MFICADSDLFAQNEISLRRPIFESPFIYFHSSSPAAPKLPKPNPNLKKP